MTKKIKQYFAWIASSLLGLFLVALVALGARKRKAIGKDHGTNRRVERNAGKLDVLRERGESLDSELETLKEEGEALQEPPDMSDAATLEDLRDAWEKELEQ